MKRYDNINPINIANFFERILNVLKMRRMKSLPSTATVILRYNFHNKFHKSHSHQLSFIHSLIHSDVYMNI